MLNYVMLTDKELLKIVVMEKSDEGIIDNLIEQYHNLSNLMVDSDEVELLKIKGIGPKRVKQIKAVN